MFLKDLKNYFSHKPSSLGFIIGPGPSIFNQDLESLKGYVTIAVNSGIMKLPSADLFLADDWAVSAHQYFYDIKDFSCIKLLYKSKLEKYSSHIKEKEIIYFDHKSYYIPSEKKYYLEGLVFTEDPLLPIIGARTAAGSCVHILHILGIKNIVLLGIDCCFSKDNKRYFWEYIDDKKTTRIDKKKIEKREIGKIKGFPIDHNSRSFLEYWEKLAVQAKKQNINIINCSGGILNCFPKMKLQEVLEKYGDRKNDRI